MKSSTIRIIIYGLLALAGLGLIFNLLTDATGFLSSIFVSIVFGLAIFGILYYFILGRRNTSSEAKKYKQAVRQSKSKYTQHRHTAPTQQQQSPNAGMKKKVKKRPNHLRVIDGNKAKRKKRASN